MPSAMQCFILYAGCIRLATAHVRKIRQDIALHIVNRSAKSKCKALLNLVTSRTETYSPGSIFVYAIFIK